MSAAFMGIGALRFQRPQPSALAPYLDALRAPAPPPVYSPAKEQGDRARAWNAEHTDQPSPLFCSRCGERIRARDFTVSGPWWDYHAKCGERAPGSAEAEVVIAVRGVPRL